MDPSNKKKIKPKKGAEEMVMSEIVTGYKATDKDMCCRGFQFELGKWHEHKGDLELCSSGFHFCEYPSGPWCYYADEGTRIFRVEAREIVRGEEPGAYLKHVARFIRLIEEIIITGDGNTGDRNTGYRNTGYRNTGDENTGDRNTGDGNTGYRNTGDWNTGDGNTGDGNTGDGNTGDGNTGDGNTGYGNTGDRNTGDGNVGNRQTGFFCKKEPEILFFDHPFTGDYDRVVVFALCKKLESDEPFDPDEEMLALPNATAERIKSLHEAHIAARKKAKTGRVI